MAKLCALDNAHQVQAAHYIINTLNEVMTTGSKFDLATFLGDYYDELASTKPEELALSYIHVTPLYMDVFLQRPDAQKLRSYLLSNGLDLQELASLAKDFEESPKPLNTVAGYLMDKAGIEDIAVVMDIEKKVVRTKGLKPAGDAVPLAMPEEVAFHARATTLFSTTGAEFNEDDIPYTDRVPYYRFQRFVLDKILESGGKDSSHLNELFPGGIFLTMMNSSQLENSRPSWIARDTPVYVVTNKFGDILPFNDKNEIGQGGIPMVYPVRALVQKEGVLTPKTKLIEITDLSKRLAREGKYISTQELKAEREKQAEELNKMTNYVMANPESKIINVITGGSHGYIPQDEKAKVPLGKVNFEGDSFNIQIQEVKGEPFGWVGATYFYVKGVSNPILLDREVMSQELKEKVASTLVDDIYIQPVGGGAPYLMPLSDRLTKVLQYRENTDVFKVSVTDNGLIELNLNGKGYVITPQNREIMRAKIIEFFSTYQRLPLEAKPKHVEEILDEEVVGWRDKLRKGSTSKKGKQYFHWVIPEITINKEYLKKPDSFDNYELSPIEGGKVFKSSLDPENGIKPVNYIDFVKDNTYVKYLTTGEGKLQQRNSYFTFRVPEKELQKVEPQEEVEVTPMDEAPLTNQGSDVPEDYDPEYEAILEQLRKNRLHKSKLTKAEEVEALESQIEAAKVWWDNHPMSKIIPFKPMFKMMNDAGVAEFFNGAIILYQGSDYSDLYHEAWHAFSQGFLTKADKEKLYGQLQGMSGSFTTHEGKRVTFNAATWTELEEFLAEDFRKYMLSDGKTLSKSTVRNTIFRRILNFLKALFGDTTVAQMMIDQDATSTIRDLYEKLRVGTLTEYTFSADNAIFNKLNKGILPLTNTDFELGPSDSFLIRESLDSALSDFVDDYNSRTEKKITYHIFSTLEGRSMAYAAALRKLTTRRNTVLRTLSKSDAGLEEINPTILANYIQQHFPVGTKIQFTEDGIDGEGVITGYSKDDQGKYTHFKTEGPDILLKDVLDNHKSKPEDLPSELTRSTEQRVLDTLNYSIKNFGDPSDIKSYNPNGRGVISYHIKKSKYLSFQDKFYEDAVDSNTSEQWGKSGNESSVFETGKPEVWYMLRSLHKTDATGAPVYNKLGFKELVDFDAVKNRLSKILHNSGSPQEMYQRLLQPGLVEKVPYIAQLLRKLGDPSTKTDPDLQHMWTSFYETFNRYLIDQPTVLLDKETDPDSPGGFRWLSKTGIAYGDVKRIFRLWDNYFTSGTTKSAFISRYARGKDPELNLARLRDKWTSASMIATRRVEFLNDIGVPIDKENQDLVEEINTNTELNAFGHYMYQRMNDLFALGPYFHVNNVSTFFKYYIGREVETDDNGVVIKTIKKGKNENRTYDALSRIFLAHTDRYSDASVSTPEGDTRYILSLNSSMTAIGRGLNGAKNFSDITNSYLSYLDQQRNPWALASKTLNSLFDFSQPGAPRREGVDYIIQNVAGLSVLYDGESTNNGVSTSGADEATKFSMDLAYFLQMGVIANATPGEKATILSTRPSQYTDSFSTGGKYWMDTWRFASGNEADLSDKIYKSMIDYLYAEHSRVQTMRNLKDGDIENNFLTYKDNGKNFHLFDSILSKDTKDMLYAIEGSLKDNMSTEVSSAIKTDFDAYWAKEFTKNLQLMKKGVFLGDNVLDMLTGPIVKGGGFNPLSRYSAFRTSSELRNKLLATVVKSFTFNAFIQNVESSIINYGDPAQYKTVVEFHKRIAMFSSTGDIFRTDDTMMGMLSEYLTDGYAASIGKDFKGALSGAHYSSVLSTAVLQDPLLTSAYYDRIESALKRDIEKQWKKSNRDYTAIDLDAAAKVQAKAYQNMTVGDGQGWIGFDAYRLLSIAIGDWSWSKQEVLFQKIKNKENIDPSIDIGEYFPILKYQYAGPLATDMGLPVMAGHKFSLMPLVPNVIEKDDTLRGLHNKMMDENIDYVLLNSASKITTMTDGEKKDYLYKDNDNVKREFADIGAWKKNDIFLEFLKKQQNTNKEFKGQSILSTQMRKIIEEGLVEGGVPVDFMPTEGNLFRRRLAWEKLPEDQKRSKSAKYELYKNYENAIAALTNSKKNQLMRQIGWDKPENKGKMTPKLVQLLEKELLKQDVSDHEIENIQLRDNITRALKYRDMSLHLSQELIEKVLLSLVNRKIIRQKINGEPLVQASEIGTEDMSRWKPEYNFTTPTPEQQAKFGTDGLTFYQDGAGPNGTTKAIKVKIALQGGFKHLLNSVHKDGNRINTIARLNEMIQDEQWLDAGNNRRMITMVGTRIPVQGLNSMEFMEVHEFLEPSAGNMIILPAEVVAKTGSDFDIDKMNIFMPNINATYEKRGDRFEPVGAELSRAYSAEETEELFNQFKEVMKLRKTLKTATEENRGEITQEVKRNQDRHYEAYDKLFNAMFGVTSSEMDSEIFDQALEDAEESISNYKDFLNVIKGQGKSEENDVLWSMRSILSDADNFASLVRPNAVYTLDPIANGVKGDPTNPALRDYVSDYNPKEDGKLSGSNLMQYRYNMYVHMVNKVAKEALAIAAVDNTFNIMFNRIGAAMQATYWDGTKKEPKILEKDVTLYLPHNTTYDEDGNKVISLSHIMDKEGREKISDNDSQIINLLLEIAKNDSAFYLQLNKEVIPTLLFMNQAGVPIKQLIYYASQPIIREYMDEIRKAKSPISEAMGWAPMSMDFETNIEMVKRNFFVNQARTTMANRYLHVDIGRKGKKGEKYYSPGNTRFKDSIRNMYTEMEKLHKEHPNAFDEDNLWKNIRDYNPNQDRKVYTEEEQLALLHWFHVEDIAKSIKNVKMRLNFDTKTSKSLFTVMNKDVNINLLTEDKLLSKDMVRRIIDDSPISSLYLVDKDTENPFVFDLVKPILPLRADELITDYLVRRMADFDEQETIEGIFGTLDKAANSFYNDMVSYVFQNTLRGFDPTRTSKFRNIPSKESVNIKRIPHLSRGATVQDGVLYYDITQLRNDWKYGNYLMPGSRVSTNKHNYMNKGLAPISKMTKGDKIFHSINEFLNFTFEREYVRANNPPSTVFTTSHYLTLASRNRNEIKKKEEWSDERYSQEIDKVTYEEYIRDVALDNIGNGWKIFKSEDNYAEQVMDTIERYELVKQYPMLANFVLSESAYPRHYNLKLIDFDLDADQIDAYHRSIQELSDPAILKTDDENENRALSSIFAKLPLVAFLQSGLTTTGQFSMTRIVPAKRLMEFMSDAVYNFVDSLTKGDTVKAYDMLDKFYAKWKSMNSSYMVRSRYKDYTVNADDKTPGLTLDHRYAQPAGTIPVYALNPDYDTYNDKELASTLGAKTAAAHKDVLFIYDLAINTDEKSMPDKSSQGYMHAAKRNPQIGNALGIFTRMSYTDNKQSMVTDDSLVTNKEAIERAIQEIKQTILDRDMRPAFPLSGMGQLLLGYSSTGKKITPDAPAPLTFAYLSQRLFEEFDYMNPHYEDLQIEAEPEGVNVRGENIQGVNLEALKPATKIVGEESIATDTLMMNNSQAAIAFVIGREIGVPNLAQVYQTALDAAGYKTTYQDFTGISSVWIFGNRPLGESIPMKDIKGKFLSSYVPLIDRAIAQGVTQFNIGNSSGIDQLSKEYLTKTKGFIIDPTEKSYSKVIEKPGGVIATLTQINPDEIAKIKAGTKTTIWTTTPLVTAKYELPDGTIVEVVNRIFLPKMGGMKAATGLDLSTEIKKMGYSSTSELLARKYEGINKFLDNSGPIYINEIEVEGSRQGKAIEGAQQRLKEMITKIQELSEEAAKADEALTDSPEAESLPDDHQLIINMRLANERLSNAIKLSGGYINGDKIVVENELGVHQAFESFQDLFDQYNEQKINPELTTQAYDMLNKMGLVKYLSPTIAEKPLEVAPTVLAIRPPSEVIKEKSFITKEELEEQIIACFNF